MAGDDAAYQSRIQRFYPIIAIVSLPWILMFTLVGAAWALISYSGALGMLAFAVILLVGVGIAGLLSSQLEDVPGGDSSAE